MKIDFTIYLVNYGYQIDGFIDDEKTVSECRDFPGSINKKEMHLLFNNMCNAIVEELRKVKGK